MVRKSRRIGRERNPLPADPDGDSLPASVDPDHNGDGDSDAGEEEVTRCLCGRDELAQSSKTRGADPGLFVQCERCHVWQHGFCVGFITEDDVPDVYYCEQCEPSFHEIKPSGLSSIYNGSSPKAAASKSKKRNSPAQDEPLKDRAGRATNNTPNNKSAKDTKKDSKDTNGKSKSFKDSKDSKEIKELKEPPESKEGKDAKLSPEYTGKEKNGKPARDSKPKDKPDNELETRDAAKAKSTREVKKDAKSSSANGAKDANKEPDHKPPRRETRSREPKYQEAKNEDSRRNEQSEEEDEELSHANYSLDSIDGLPERGRRRRREGSDLVLGDRASRARRRSREEDLILQRVLAESAREAREKGLDADDVGFPDDGSKTEDVEIEQSIKRPRRNGRAAQNAAHTQNGASTQNHNHTVAHPKSSEDETNANSSADLENGFVEPPPPVVPGGRRKRKIPSSAGAGMSNAGTAAHPGTRAGRRPGRAPANSVTNERRKCNPRIPSARSTIQEMRRRIAAIIEFSGRTQNDLTDEAKAREAALKGRKAQVNTLEADEFIYQLEVLTKCGNENMALLEELTRKLLLWQDEFGS